MPGLKRATAPRRYEMVEEQILRMLGDGELAPGDHLLPERDLALQLGVSRPSVRMALSSLASRGLVDITPRGTFVTQTDLSHSLAPVMTIMVNQQHAIDEFIAFRKITEVGAVRLACENAKGEDIRQLEQHLAKLNRAVTEGTDPQEPDRKFHMAIGRATHNLFVVQMMNLFATVTSDAAYAPILQALYSPPGELRAWVSRSQSILTAIKARDAESAAREMTAYVERVEAIVQALFADKES